MRRLYIFILIFLGILLGLVARPLPTFFVKAQAVPTRTVHKFVGSGECKEKEIPEHAVAAGWEDGPCPAQPEPTSLPPEPTATPKPPEPTSTSPPAPTATDKPPAPTATDKPPPPSPTSEPTQPPPTNTPGPGPQPSPTSTPDDDDDGSTTITIPDPVIIDPVYPIYDQPIYDQMICDPCCCCPLDPSEVTLNYSKAALLDAIADQVREGNMPAITIDID